MWAPSMWVVIVIIFLILMAIVLSIALTIYLVRSDKTRARHHNTNTHTTTDADDELENIVLSDNIDVAGITDEYANLPNLNDDADDTNLRSQIMEPKEDYANLPGGFYK